MPDKLNVLVFGGGLGLGAYHAGVYEAFPLPLHWCCGSSVGAITCALIAGSPPEARVSALRAYWEQRAAVPVHSSAGPSRHAFAWMAALGTRLLGSEGHFHPRLPTAPLRFRSLYDLGPTRERLARLVDFGRLNGGETRTTIATTDLKSGDVVLFDSTRDRITLDHILASCGFLPEFAPLEIDGRWLADGGLSINAPFDPVLTEPASLRLYVIDVFARDGEVPASLEAASERKSDLMMGNQTYQRLRLGLSARRLRWQLEQHEMPDDTIYLLSYRPGAEEAGPEKSFDFSRSAIAQRWRAGGLDMQQADRAFRESDGIRQVRRGA
ncbi:MAG: patatin-like phospholipase family protein [Bradyrhizobium sp.]